MPQSLPQAYDVRDSASSLHLLPPNRAGTVVVFQANLLQCVYVGKVTFDVEGLAETGGS